MIKDRLRYAFRIFVAGAVLATLVLVMDRASAAAAPAWCTDKSDVAILGTSADTGFATTGYNGATPVNDGYMATTYGWTKRFADLLAAGWSTTTSNYAHNGSMASDYLPGGRWPMTTGAIAALGPAQPSIVVLDEGGNEFYSQVPPATFKANLGAVIDAVHVQRPDAVVVLSTYAELDRSAGVATYGPTVSPWSAYATAIRETAVEKGSPMLDLRQYVPPASAASQPSPSLWTSDKIHLNEAGNMVELGAYWGWTSSLWSMCG